MSAIMDMYLSASDSLSLQEMLDIDIKSEIDTLIGGHNDFSGFNFSDLPPLEIEDSHDIKWFSTNSNHSNSSFNIGGDECTAMVNPNVVMPIISLAHNVRSPSPSFKESHLTFSPSTIKISNPKTTEAAEIVKKDLIKIEMVQQEDIKPIVTKITPVITKPVVKATVVKSSAPTLLSFRNTVQRQLNSPVAVTQISNFRTITTSNHTARKQQFNNNRIFEEEERAYPKPAYSYSCLIAMALKNSKTGSLPVSEIYNFMCKHFPYFKTAPSGWKNSVRHNLSLNKCFEKIEKPAPNGAQRKGCLWAMNPAKISKMDEEVQKWSRKDPVAIRKAMVNPENLEALEKGELKFSCCYDESDNFGDSCGSAESEEGSDSEAEVDHSSEYINITTIKPENTDDEADLEVFFKFCLFVYGKLIFVFI